MRKAGVAFIVAAPLLGKGRGMGAPFTTPGRHLLFTVGGDQAEARSLAFEESPGFLAGSPPRAYSES
jgi:hypothetical protein